LNGANTRPWRSSRFIYRRRVFTVERIVSNKALADEQEPDLLNARLDAATASSSAQINNPVPYSAPRPHPGKKKFIRRQSKNVIAGDTSSAKISISNSKSSSSEERGHKRKSAALEQSSLSGDGESNSSSSKSGKSNRRTKKQRVEEGCEVEANIPEEQMSSEQNGHAKQNVDFAGAEKIVGASDVIFLDDEVKDSDSVVHPNLSRKSFLMGPFLADLRNDYQHHHRLVREETELRQARNDLVAVFRDLPQSHILNVDEDTVKLIQMADTRLPELRDEISSSNVNWSF